MSTYLARSLTILALFSYGCGDGGSGDDVEPPLRCAGGATGRLTSTGSIAVVGDASFDLNGAAIAAGPGTTLPASDVNIECADDIVPEGFVALGPAVRFGAVGTWSDRPFTLTLPYRASRMPTGSTNAAVRVVARRHVGDGTSFFPPLANRALDTTDANASRLQVRAGELTTYQVVAAVDAGTPRTERFSFRGIVGISMGGNAAMSIALSHPDRFDAFADLGGEPGPSMRYTLTMIRDYLFGGFCTAADELAGTGLVGELCPTSQRPPMADQSELPSDFDHMIYQDGDGVGLTLSRDFYMKAARDLARSFSNPALYNPDDPYLPPGVDSAYLARPAVERCADPIVLANFFDREFNPDGSLPVITFCDGNDGATLGTIDPTVAADNPAEILLAVDVNNNGLRDPGEPVITNAYEPFDDVGSDGVASINEPGYDAVTNPDPAGDDYHWQRNPRGIEGNWHRDSGEPFEDVGLDGIGGTCQYGGGPACYDFGEGDGVWTLSPNVARWYQSDAQELLAAMTPTQRAHVSMWFDGGIRDMLNASLSANTIGGYIGGDLGLPLAVYDGFALLTGANTDNGYDFTQVDWTQQPRNGLLRYGNPDATASEIDFGDGRHVGTAVQVVNRAATAFSWLDKRIADGDRLDASTSGQQLSGLSFITSTGRESPYAVYLPPGYDQPENQAKRYPVVYFLHGYGQEPEDLLALSAVFQGYMLPTSLPDELRFQKLIIVYVDGRCRPGSNSLPIPAGGDGCEEGTFYKDAPALGAAQMETALLELADLIDSTYRTKSPADVQISP